MIAQDQGFLTGRFEAMGCPCEILIGTADHALGDEQFASALQEAQRIENKFSRYRAGNIVDAINQSRGKEVQVDDETAAILDYAATCYDMSEGLFDITTGSLRKGSPLAHIGWSHVSWKRPFFQMPSEFEIDLGGICKEYAADQVLKVLQKRSPLATLVNLGGDIAAAGERLWSVGIEDVSRPGQVKRTIHLKNGGVATSGTTKRGDHIFNPKTGQAVQNAPASVTVAAKTCTEAGFWSTLALLQGSRAEAFLKEQGLESWCFRS